MAGRGNGEEWRNRKGRKARRGGEGLKGLKVAYITLHRFP